MAQDMEETFQVSAVNPPHKKGLLTCTPQVIPLFDFPPHAQLQPHAVMC